jgi:hypothetical protein
VTAREMTKGAMRPLPTGAEGDWRGRRRHHRRPCDQDLRRRPRRRARGRFLRYPARRVHFSRRPVGCGKSTLLRIIAGLIDKSSGSLKVHDDEVTEPRKDVAMMFQKPTLLAWRTAVENVLLPSEIAGKVTDEDRKRALGLLKLAGLKDFAFSLSAAAFRRHAATAWRWRACCRPAPTSCCSTSRSVRWTSSPANISMSS